MGQMAVGLNPLHQTVNPVGPNFTPNLTLYGWFTLYWNSASQDLTIGQPTGLLTNGAEFIIDIIRNTYDGEAPHSILWDGYYAPLVYKVDYIPDVFAISAFPWDGGGLALPMFGAGAAIRTRWLLLNGSACLQAQNRILPY